MKKSFVALAGALISSAASAHPSLMPHNHPHGVSPLAGIDVLLLLLFAIAVFGFLSARRG